MIMTPYFFASTYGSGSYTNNVFNGATTSTGTSSVSHSSSSSSSLVDTGASPWLAITVAAVLILVAVVVYLSRRKPPTNSA